MCVIAEEEELLSSEGCKEQMVVLKILPSPIVPANSAGCFKCQVLNGSSKLWMVSTAGAVGAKGDWVTPNCVVEVKDGVLTIPVVTSTHTLSDANVQKVS